MNQTVNVILCLSLSAVVAGCASITPSRMVPDTVNTTLKTGESIRRVVVSGEQGTAFGGPAYAKQPQIQKAVELALIKSEMFESVGHGEGNLDLLVAVRSQSQNLGTMLRYEALMTLTYRLVDHRNAEEVFATTLESAASSQKFSGAKRTVTARETSMQENLKALLAALQAQWPRS